MAALRTFVVVLIICSYAPTATLAGTAEDDFNQAVQLYNAKKYDLAALAFGKFTKAHATHTKVAVANFYRGICLSNAKKYRAARTVFRDMLRTNRDAAQAPRITYRIARCSFLLEDFAAAETEYKAFVDKYDKHNYRRYVLADYGETLRHRNKMKDAVTAFETFLREFKSGNRFDDVRFSLAQSYADLKQPAKAIGMFEQLAASPLLDDESPNPVAGDAAIALGKIQYRLKEYEKAFKAFDVFVKHFAKDKRLAQVQLWSGFCEYQRTRYSEAATLFEQAANEAKLTQQADYWRALAFKKIDKNAEAIVLFKKVRASKPAASMVAETHYRQAECEIALSKFSEAKANFLVVVDDHAKHSLADNALLGAIEASRRLKDFEGADKLIGKFERDFRTSPLLGSVRLGKAKVLYSRGRPADLLKASVSLSNSIATTRDVAQLAEMRLWLGRVEIAREKHAEAITALKPLLETDATKLKDEEKPASAEAWLPAAEAYYALGAQNAAKFVDCSTAARMFLARRKSDPARERGWQLLAISLQEQKDTDNAKKAITDFASDAPGSKLISPTRYLLAEIAYRREQYPAAEAYYGELVKLGKESKFHAAGLSGVAWSQFQQKSYEAAATSFQQVVTDHAANTDFAPEAVYQAARSLELAEKGDDATTAYAAAFTKLKPTTPAKPGIEQEAENPLRYAYLAGLQRARMLRKANKTGDAAGAYSELLTSFPKPKNLDKLLNEWGGMHYDAGEYGKADVIWKRLIKDVPGSELVDDAQLNLIESDLEGGRVQEARTALGLLVASKTTDDWVRGRSRWHLVRLDFDAGKDIDVIAGAKLFAQDHAKSELLPEIQFFEAESSLRLGKRTAASTILSSLRAEKEKLDKHPWFARVFVLQGEIAWQKKDYPGVEKIAADFDAWKKDHPRAYQMQEVLGRAFKSRSKHTQARTAFEKVVKAKAARGTETAAKAQFLIGESYLEESASLTDAEKKNSHIKQALLAYMSVFDRHTNHPEWQAPAQFQVGQCYETLRDIKEAIAAYKKLEADKFAKTEWATKARGRIKVLEALP